MTDKQTLDFWHTIRNMLLHGDSFTKSLARLMQTASKENRTKLQDAFPDIMEKHQKERTEHE